MSVTLNGTTVYLTGAVPGMTKAKAEGMLSAAGAYNAPSWNKSVELLIVAPGKPGQKKIDAARLWGTPMITWADAEALMSGAAAVAEPTVPPPASTVRHQPVAARTGYRQIKPMKCKGADQPPKGEYVYEPKWDGYRCVATVLDAAGGDVVLASGSGKEFVDYPHIAEELREGLAAKGISCVLDGELVIVDAGGRSKFSSIHRGDPSEAKFVVFDVLSAMGNDVTATDLVSRRQLLVQLLEGLGRSVTITPAFTTRPVLNAAGEDIAPLLFTEISDADELMEYAKEADLEGIVAKRFGTRYVEGARNETWQKIKLRREQEFVIVGYTDGAGARAGTIGAVVLAVNEGTKTNAKWAYCGKAGSGGTYDDFENIRKRLTKAKGGLFWTEPIQVTMTPAEMREITWVVPEVVVQVKFQGWTEDDDQGVLWHPSIQGIREDKNAFEVRRDA